MKRLLTLAGALGVVALLTAVSVAAWLVTGTGTVEVRASSIPAGARPVASASGSDVTVDWGPDRTLLAGTSTAVTGYLVRRYAAGSATPEPVGAGCAGRIARTTCAEAAVPTGRWEYTVAAVYERWTGAEGARSVPVPVAPAVPADQTAPTVDVAFPAAGGAYHAAGWTAACGTPTTADLCGTAADAGTGVASVGVSVRRDGDGFWWNGVAFVESAGVGELFHPVTAGTTSWTYDLPRPADGRYTVRARAVDGAANTGYSAARTLTVDTVAPGVPAAPDLTAATDTGTSDSDNLVTSSAPTFAGTAEAGATVTLHDGATTIGSGTATGGSYSITPSAALAAGVRSLSVRATDAAGNVSAPSAALAVTVDAVAPSVSAVALVNGGGTAGVAEKGDRVEVAFSEPLGVGTLCSAWSGDGSSQAVNSASTVTVTIADDAGNDTLTVTTTSAACGTFNFGSVALGADYVGGGSLTFGGGGNDKSLLAWDAAARKLVVTLGLRSGSARPAVTAATVSYSPSGAIRDPAGNAIGTAAVRSATAQRF